MVTITIVVLLSKEFQKAARRISKLSYKDKEIRAEFHKELEMVDKEVKSLPNPSMESTEMNNNESDNFSGYDRLLRLVEISPRAAIMEAWMDIEITTKAVTDKYGISVNGRIAGVKAIRQLVN